MKPFSIFLFIIIAATSCQKQTTKNTATPDNEMEHSEISGSVSTDISPGNPANPYDSAGILHNRALASVRNYMQQTGDETITGTVNIIRNYFKVHRKLDMGDPLLFIPIGMMEAVTRDHNGFLSRTFLSVPMRVLYTQFIDSLKKFTVFNRKLFKSFVMNYENQVMQRKDFTDTERRILLIAFSITRHSGFYWSAGLENNVMRVPRKPGFLRKLGAVVSAVIGDGIAAAGLHTLDAPFDELVEISVTGSQAMYLWITGAYGDGR